MRKFLPTVLITCFFLNSCAAATPSPTLEVQDVPIEIPTFETLPPPCTAFEANSTAMDTAESLFPPVTQEDRVRGPSNATVTIIEYGDFQCPYCRSLSPVLADLLETYPEDLRLVFRHLPLTAIHDKAMLAARASEAAGEQDKFWEMHDLLYEKQSLWQDMSADAFRQWLINQTAALELDGDKFAADLDRADINAEIEQSLQYAQENNMLFTPLVIINGEITTIYDYNNLYDMVALLALSKRQFTTCPPAVINSNHDYIATLVTEHGEIVIQLFPEEAPLAVNNFVFLAQNGWYDDITFHRVIADGFAQTGDPSGTGDGTPGYLFEVEIDPSLQFDKPGVVAMYNFGQGTNGSQFFITYTAVPDLNNKFTIFGQVLKGLDVLEKLTPRNPEPGVITPPGDKLIRITIEEK